MAMVQRQGSTKGSTNCLHSLSFLMKFSEKLSLFKKDKKY